MSWLRIDDGFAEHRKLLQLKRADRWTWMELLCYCARQSDMGAVPDGIGDIIRHATTGFLRDCVNVGLLDDTPDGLRVHDWLIYNADTIEAKVAAYMAKHPDAPANEVQRAIGGKRELVLEVVRRYQEAVPDSVPEEPVGNRSAGTKSVHARVHPSPTPFTNTNQPTAANPEVGRSEYTIDINNILKKVADA